MRISLSRSRAAALAVGVLALALIVVFGIRTHLSTQAGPTTLGGRSAPLIAGTDLVSGDPISLHSLHGRYVVVDFFASWCGPCLAEEPQIEAFTFAHRNDAHVGFLGVDIDDSTNNAKDFFARYGATWPAVVDLTGSIAQSYGVTQPPELFLVDPAGKIVSSISQQVDATELSNWVTSAEAERA